MNQIQIIDTPPIILTRDKNWLSIWGKKINMKPGAIIVLPDDAVLLMPPEDEEQK